MAYLDQLEALQQFVRRHAAAVERGQFHHDREPEPRTRLGLVKPPAPPRDLLPLGRRQPRPVVVNHDPNHRTVRLRLLETDLDRDPCACPLEGVVDQIADHLLEVLPLAAELDLGRGLDVDLEVALDVDLGQRARTPVEQPPVSASGIALLK